MGVRNYQFPIPDHHPELRQGFHHQMGGGSEIPVLQLTTSFNAVLASPSVEKPVGFDIVMPTLLSSLTLI